MNIARINNARNTLQLVEHLRNQGVVVPAVNVNGLAPYLNKRALETAYNILKIVAILLAVSTYLKSASFKNIGDLSVKLSIIRSTASLVKKVAHVAKLVVSHEKTKGFAGLIFGTFAGYSVSQSREIVMHPERALKKVYMAMASMKPKNMLLPFVPMNPQNVATGAAFGTIANTLQSGKALQLAISFAETSAQTVLDMDTNTMKQLYSGATYGFGMTAFRDFTDKATYYAINLCMMLAVLHVQKSFKFLFKNEQRAPTPAPARALLMNAERPATPALNTIMAQTAVARRTRRSSIAGSSLEA